MKNSETMVDLDTTLKEEIVRNWDIDSESYDTYPGHGIHSEEERSLWKEYISSVLPKGTLRILDVGCGTGQISILMSQMGHTVTGLDLSSGMMEKAKEKARAKDLDIVFLYGDAENPPFEDEMFDGIIERHLLWTLPHPKKALDTWNHILVPGGSVILIEGLWNDRKISTRIRKGTSNWIDRIVTGSDNKHKEYSPTLQKALPYLGGMLGEQAAELLKGAGFSDVTIIDLSSIHQNQRTGMPWYRQLTYNWTYFLAQGKKLP